MWKINLRSLESKDFCKILDFTSCHDHQLYAYTHTNIYTYKVLQCKSFLPQKKLIIPWIINSTFSHYIDALKRLTALEKEWKEKKIRKEWISERKNRGEKRKILPNHFFVPQCISLPQKMGSDYKCSRLIKQHLYVVYTVEKSMELENIKKDKWKILYLRHLTRMYTWAYWVFCLFICTSMESGNC